MVNVLIISAAGPVSHTLCSTLVHSGRHRVYGLAETAETASYFVNLGVFPILGDLFNGARLREAMEAHPINVVVGVVGAPTFPLHALFKELKRLGKARLAESSEAGKRTEKIGFIYCSGIGVARDSPKPINNELPPPYALEPPSQQISWLPEFEKDVVHASDVLDVMVVRSALIFGCAHPTWSRFFQPINKAIRSGAKTVYLPAEPDSHPGLVHALDVASGLHAAIEKLAFVATHQMYPVFDLVTSQESMRDILESAAKALGFKGKVVLDGSGHDRVAREMCMSPTRSSAWAIAVLGWQPKKIGFVRGMDVYAAIQANSK